MDSSYLTSGPHFAEKKVNPLKRKRTNSPHEGSEPHPEKKPVEKRRRTETPKRRVSEKAAISSSYTVGKLLGKGGSGFIYAGRRKSDGKRVAIKFMRKQRTDAFITIHGDTQRLPLEVALLKLVCKPPHSPFVIELLEWFDTPKHYILVLERFSPCIDLFDYLNTVKMTENRAKLIMRQVIGAACHCRDREVFHSDIKIENILINPRTLEVKLTDFGCGRLVQDTPYTQYTGTRSYHPPEWITDRKYKAEPATVWSLGILLYDMLCGRCPIKGKQEILDGQLHFPASLSHACCSLITWCLEKDPTRRPSLVQILAHDWF